MRHEPQRRPRRPARSAERERRRRRRSSSGPSGSGLARACHAMARSFARGGTLIPFGTGAAATDAAHVAVEFMHPVIVGKRALPAIAPTNDPTGASRLAPRLRAPTTSRSAISHGAGLTRARGVPRRGAPPRPADDRDDRRGRRAAGRRPRASPCPATTRRSCRRLQETAYHVLWELVHVFFEHPGLLDDACITCGDVAVQARVVAVAQRHGDDREGRRPRGRRDRPGRGRRGRRRAALPCRRGAEKSATAGSDAGRTAQRRRGPDRLPLSLPRARGDATSTPSWPTSRPPRGARPRT